MDLVLGHLPRHVADFERALAAIYSEPTRGPALICLTPVGKAVTKRCEIFHGGPTPTNWSVLRIFFLLNPIGPKFYDSA